MALPLFAITLFVSAFLLFLVQPMIGKLILPKLGGTPQVWNTCMVFFQSVLLLGYAYTHSVSTKLKLRQQLVLHCVLLVIPIGLILWNPFYDAVHGWTPPSGSNPIPQTLLLLATVVGIPFFVVSTSAPLLQKWFAYSGDPAAKDPYFLYGASNLGSLLSLLLYPALVEPWTTLPTQTNIWLVGYVALAGMIAYCAYRIYLLAPPDSVLEAQAALASAPESPAPAAPAASEPPAPVPAAQASTSVKAGPGPGGGRSISRKKGKHHHAAAGPAVQPEEEKSIAKPGPAPLIATGATAPMTTWRRVRWVLLAAVPSSLMLGITSYISTDLSPFPLLWVVPLALYLLAFILVFMKVWTGKRVQVMASHYTPHEMILYLAQPLGLVILCFILLSRGFSPFSSTLMCMFGFFATALACHGELAHDRPSTKYLTEYFLWMSVGGMLGGMFNGILAPIVFQTGIWEFHICVVIACMVRPQYMPSGWFDDLILNAFPGLQSWSRNQGDELAKSFGKPAPHTTYFFSLILDVILGIFVLSISYYLATTFIHQGTETTFKVAKMLLMPVKETPQTIAEQIATEKWTKITFYGFVYFLPMIFCFFFSGRPIRFSLAVAGLLFANLYLAASDERAPLEARRTYFGLLRVQKDREGVRNTQEADLMRDPDVPLDRTDDGKLIPRVYPFTFLMHGTTYHGRNYMRPTEETKGNADLSRLSTTYYHRYGPVGIVLEKYNWWSMPEKRVNLTEEEKKRRREANPGAQNDWSADLRMPATLIGQTMGGLGIGADPLSAIVPVAVDSWSEPPIATIGLGTGTMASYARPYGWFTYYEIDDVMRGFSLPEGGGEARFTYLQNAIRRGVNLEVLMGDARQTLEREAENPNRGNSYVFFGDFRRPRLGQKYPYADAPYNHDAQYQCKSPNREKFYKAINVDAFSSDAIPIHLVTKQAIALYLSKLTDDGVLCVHTSNRHMDLVRPVARIAMELSAESEKAGGPKINCLVGKDGDKGRFMGHFSSEYVMIYRGDEFKKHVDFLAQKKKEFTANLSASKDRDAADKLEREGKFMMIESRAADGSQLLLGPDGWQILNSVVTWYDPYQDLEEGRFGRTHSRVTQRDSLWTDDYTNILSILR